MGLVLDVVLLILSAAVIEASGGEAELRNALLPGLVAGLALAAVLPVLWRGAIWQLTLALLLLAPPGFCLLLMFYG